MTMKYFIAGLLFFVMAPAQAMTFASGAGADSGGCGAITSPCRTLQQAVTNAPAGGYVVLQGPADFGRATVEKSLTIVGEGGATLNGAGAPSNEGVIVVIAGANDTVRLRGLTLLNAPTGGAGVAWLKGKSLEIAGCNVSQTQGAGILGQLLNGGGLTVVDTVISAPTGILTGSQNGSFRTYLNGLRISGSQYGLWLGQGWSQTPSTVIVNSSVTNANSGLRTLSGDLIARNISISNGGNALHPYGGVNYLSRSTITGNAKVIETQFGDGALLTFGDNAIRGNADETLTRTLSTTYH